MLKVKAEIRYKIPCKIDGLNHYVTVDYEAFEDGGVKIIKITGHEKLSQDEKNKMFVGIHTNEKLFEHAFRHHCPDELL